MYGQSNRGKGREGSVVAKHNVVACLAMFIDLYVHLILFLFNFKPSIVFFISFSTKCNGQLLLNDKDCTENWRRFQNLLVCAESFTHSKY